LTTGYYEDLAVRQEAIDRQEAAERVREYELAEEEKRERKARNIRMMGTDPRKSATLTMHAAMGEPLAEAMPLVESFVGLIPVLGQAVAVIEGVTGESLFTGEELDAGERALSLLLAAIPEAGTILRAGARGAKVVVEIARQTHWEARAVLRMVQSVARASAEDVAAIRTALAAAKTGKTLTEAERKAGQRLLRTLDDAELGEQWGAGYGKNGRGGAGKRTKGAAPGKPLPATHEEIRDTLLGEHPGLHPAVATDAARGSVSAKGPGGRGADLDLIDGGGREVSVHHGAFTTEAIGGHLLGEVRQESTTEIFLQISSPGATRQGFLKMLPALRSGSRDLQRVYVKVFGPDGSVWWNGRFLGLE
jgi:putative toxin of predicted polymorphic toxin system